MCFSLSPSGASGGNAREHLACRTAQLRAGLVAQLLRDRAHVVAAIAIGRKWNRLAGQLQVPQPHADGEDVHLPAGIVDVVLAKDAVPGGGEQRSQGRAVSRLPAVADMQRPRGIRRNELDDHPAAFAEPAFAIAGAQLVDAPDLGRVSRGREEEIDEAGAGDLGPIDQGARGQSGHDGLRELPRIAARRLRMT